MGLRLQDLIDIEQFQMLQDRLNEIYSFPSAIIDNEGHVLTATAWQDICSKYHRRHPECEKECIISDQYIIDHLHEANPAVSYECPHGLIDNATPIIIEGVHYGNFRRASSSSITRMVSLPLRGCGSDPASRGTTVLSSIGKYNFTHVPRPGSL